MMIPITIHDSINPAGLVRRLYFPNLTETSFGGWAVSARVVSPNDRPLSASEAGEHSRPSQTGFRQTWRRRLNRRLD